MTKIDVPDDVEVSTFADQLIIELRKPWTVNGVEYAAGSLLAVQARAYIAGDCTGLTILFAPTSRTSLDRYSGTLNYLVLHVLDSVQTKLVYWKYDYTTQTWVDEARTWAFPNMARASASGIDPDSSDDLFIIRTGFTEPTALFLGSAAPGIEPEELRRLNPQFDSSGQVVRQLEATSKDGTKIPYWIISKEDVQLDGSNPTLLYGYGGFEISLLPSYAASVGLGWLESGGVYVQANIRGGGEFGPKWHQAALKEKRHKAYEDFIAVGEDLIARKYTKTARLGIMGGSNGGLLMGNMLTMRPDLWGAVVCQVPLLDMQRFNKLLAGASWVGEYGDPDVPEEWAFLKNYSPYHNVKPGILYPPTLFTTSTRDDRVHPGHARKMAKLLLDHGSKNTIYYENIEGGHGGAADNKQLAFMKTLEYEFLRKILVENAKL